MFKLVLEKTEEPAIKLPTSTVSSKKQESSRKTSTSASLTTPKPLTVWITTKWKILKEMGASDPYLHPEKSVCRSRSRSRTVRTRHGTKDWFQIGKRVFQGCTLPACLFNLHAEYIMWNVWLDEAQGGIQTAGRNINNFRYTEVLPEGEELKSLMMKVKELA